MNKKPEFYVPPWWEFPAIIVGLIAIIAFAVGALMVPTHILLALVFGAVCFFLFVWGSAMAIYAWLRG